MPLQDNKLLTLHGGEVSDLLTLSCIPHTTLCHYKLTNSSLYMLTKSTNSSHAVMHTTLCHTLSYQSLAINPWEHGQADQTTHHIVQAHCYHVVLHAYFSPYLLYFIISFSASSDRQIKPPTILNELTAAWSCRIVMHIASLVSRIDTCTHIHTHKKGHLFPHAHVRITNTHIYIHM
jgi:hypothetical protein